MYTFLRKSSSSSNVMRSLIMVSKGPTIYARVCECARTRVYIFMLACT